VAGSSSEQRRADAKASQAGLLGSNEGERR